MLGTGEGKIREREDDVCLDSRSRFLLRELAFIERALGWSEVKGVSYSNFTKRWSKK